MHIEDTKILKKITKTQISNPKAILQSVTQEKWVEAYPEVKVQEHHILDGNEIC